MTTYKVGDRVHIEFDATVEYVGNYISVVADGGLSYSMYEDSPDMNISLVKRANIWTDGDIVQSTIDNEITKRPCVWYRENGSWKTSEEIGGVGGTDELVNDWLDDNIVVIVRKSSTGNSTGVSIHFPVGGIKRTAI